MFADGAYQREDIFMTKTAKIAKRISCMLLTLCVLASAVAVLPITAFASNEARIIPSATSGAYDDGTNTLTVVGSGEVSFTPSSGIEFESVEGTKQPNGEKEIENPIVDASFDGTKWVVTLPNEDAEYIFRGYYSIENSTEYAECTVVINYGLRTPANLRWNTISGTVAVWDAVDGATSYIVELWKKDIISLRLISHEVSDTSFEFYLTTLSQGSYYFTIRAVTEDIRSNVATSDDIIITSGGTPIVIGGVSVSIDSIDGTAYIVNRDDIADASIREIDLSETSTTTMTDEQAIEIINGLRASWERYPTAHTYKDYIGLQLEDYSLADLEVILSNIKRGLLPNDYIADVVIEKIESKKATDLVIAPGYIDSASAFKVTTGQGLGVTYSNDAIKDLVASVGADSNVKVETNLEKAEITRDEARIIVAGWAEIVNTAEGEEQIKNLLLSYSIYELALLQQYTKILILEDSTAQKLYDLMWVEREKKKEQAAAKDNEEPLATFSVNTYAVAADGTQTYIPVSRSMQYAIPVDTSSVPENATLSLYRLNQDGTRTKQEILSISDNMVIAQTDGNSDYVLVYEVNEPTEPDGLSTGAIVAIVIACVVVIAGGAVAICLVVSKKKKYNG